MKILNKGKRLSAFVLCVVMIVMAPVGIFAEEAVPQEELTSDVAVGLMDAIIDHLIMYARDEKLSKGSLYEAAAKKLIEENPELFERALKGMLESIDEYSEYYTPEEAKALVEDITGEITGIGVSIDFSNVGAPRVASVIPDTPAERAGLKVDDILISADGVEFKSLNSEDILSRIKGEAGTAVHLVVNRGGSLVEFDIVREAIVGTSVVPEVYESNGKKLMYIGVYGFVSNTAEKFKEALDAADKEKITNLIIDLRNNGGGILDQAIAMADNFVPKDKIITTEDHKITLLNQVYKGTKVEKNKYNTVVLINKNSASSSEVLAAALKENEVATLIGEKSFGKGTIQSINSLMTGGMIKFTSGYYLTPNGNNISGVGIEPDIAIDNIFDKIDMSRFKDFEYTKVYQKGDKNEAVKTAKEMLQFLGLYKGEIDDVYDEDLYYAIFAFQKQVGVYPYGVMDITTQIQLRNYMSSAKFETDKQIEAAFEHFGMTYKR